MDNYLSRSGADGVLTPRKRYTAPKEVVADEDHRAQFCNRVGCNGRIKYVQNAKFGCSSDRDEVTRKSSRNGSSAVTYAKSNVDFEEKLLSQTKFELKGNGKSSLLAHPQRRSLERPVVSSDVRPQTTFHRKSALQHRSASPASAVSSDSKTSSLVPFSSQNGNRCRTKNVKSNSVSDAAPTSPSRLSKSVGKKTNKKRSSGESGLGSSGDYGSSNSSVLPRRRSMDVNTGLRLSSRKNERKILSGSPRGQSSVTQVSVSGSRSSNFSSSRGDTPVAAPVSREIAEVLLALERIEQDEELTLEQAHVLEAGMIHNRHDLFDQHQDMRLDIDNMSYEELLALEERMGTVSTGLSEEALSNCLKKSTHMETGPKGLRDNSDDSKCSICQEEYAAADEIAELIECRHEYHLTCINRWLQLKNWCPICKGSVAPSQS